MSLEFHLALFQKDTTNAGKMGKIHGEKKDPAPARAEKMMLESTIFIMVLFLD